MTILRCSPRRPDTCVIEYMHTQNFRVHTLCYEIIVMLCYMLCYKKLL